MVYEVVICVACEQPGMYLFEHNDENLDCILCKEHSYVYQMILEHRELLDGVKMTFVMNEPLTMSETLVLCGNKECENEINEMCENCNSWFCKNHIKNHCCTKKNFLIHYRTKPRITP